jgi:hypothetical protein
MKSQHAEQVAQVGKTSACGIPKGSCYVKRSVVIIDGMIIFDTNMLSYSDSDLIISG